MKDFAPQEFLQSLNDSTTIFPLLKYTSRPKAIRLYTQFMASSTFRLWFAGNRQRANDQTNQLIHEAVLTFKVQPLLRSLDAVGLRRLRGAVEFRLAFEASQGHEEHATQLKSQLADVLTALNEV